MRAFRFGRPGLAYASVVGFFATTACVSQAGPQSGSQTVHSVGSGHELVYDQNELQTIYGTYSETAFSLPNQVSDPVRWQVVDATLPVGYQLEETSASQVSIFGTAQFTGQWCFVLSGSTQKGVKASSRICFVAGDDDNGDYPKFADGTDRSLDNAIKGRMYQKTVGWAAGTAAITDASLFDGELPDGLDLSVDSDNSEFVIKGSPSQAETSTFVLGLTDQAGNSNYRQFTLFGSYLVPSLALLQ